MINEGIMDNVENQSKVQKKEEVKISLLLIFGFILIMFALVSIIFRFNHMQNEKQLYDVQMDEVELIEKALQNKAYFAISTLLITAESALAKDTLKSQYDVTDDVLANLLSDAAETIGLYDQLRVLDADGMEIIRIDYSENEGSLIKNKEALQDKSERYYFIETMALSPDELYMSPLDLNVENGEIEEPKKPMLRIGKRIDDDDGTPLGIVMVNINAQSFLDAATKLSVHEEDNVFLLNEEGYYLLSPFSEDEFAFMYDDKQAVGFFSDYPKIWKNLIATKSYFETDNGNFYIKRTQWVQDLENGVPNNVVYIVMQVPNSVITADDNALIVSLAFAFGVLCVVFSVVGWILGKQLVQNKRLKKELIKNATIDILTGLYNRRFIYEQLNHAIKLSKRSKNPLTIIFSDLNDLKKTNDNLGHEMGDRMLVSAATALRNSARDTDMVARIGGDEFLILLRSCNLKDAELIRTRVAESFRKLGNMYKQKQWTMSFGIAQFNGHEAIEDLIARADTLMYINKKMIKESLKDQSNKW